MSITFLQCPPAEGISVDTTLWSLSLSPFSIRVLQCPPAEGISVDCPRPPIWLFFKNLSGDPRNTLNNFVSQFVVSIHHISALPFGRGDLSWMELCVTICFFPALCLSHFCSALLQRGSQLTAPALRLADLLSHHSQTLVKVEPTNFRSKSHWMAFRETGLDPLFSTPFLNLLMIGWFLWCFCQ